MEDHSVDLTPLSTTSSTSSSSSPYLISPAHLTSPSTHRLTVKELSFTLHRAPSISFPRSKLKPVEILKSVSFSASSSELLAIVGPSGAGKSTLLRILSGRARRSSFTPRSISLDGETATSPSRLRRISGLVPQDDNLLPLLTVKETLMFSAKFRLRGVGKTEREDRVQSLMNELGLLHIADAYVGDAETRGISGGERKRVAIGIDVLHDPPVLLLDEPTSGLDSTSALQIVELLSSMARSRQQILILTIHQPSYRILKYVSDLLLLSRGRVAHCGTLESLESSISQLGYRIPHQLNPLEFAMEIIRQLEEQNADFHTPQLTHFAEPPTNQGLTIGRTRRKFCSRVDEIAYLSCRFWKIMYRTKQLFLARTGHAIVGGLGLGSVFMHLKSNESGVAERLGFFAFSLSFLLSSTVEALPIFLQERRVIMKESSRRMYRLSSYVIANSLVTIPFLLVVALLFASPVYWLVGLNPSLAAFFFFLLVVWLIVMMASSLVVFLSAVAKDFVLGNYLICVFLGAFFLFSGYFIPKGSIPKYWVFMYYASLYRYPLDALLINEYWSAREKCAAWFGDGRSVTSVCLLTGEDVLRSRGLERDSRWANVGIMCGFILMYRVFAWAILVRKSSRTML